MHRLKKIIGLKAKERKYEGMQDPKTNLPCCGKLTELTHDKEGKLLEAKTMTGSFKGGKECGHYRIQISKDLHYEGEMAEGKIDGIGKLIN